MKYYLLSLIVIVSLAGCASPGGEEATARQALSEFFGYLNSAEYDKAVALYGGDYLMLREWNPEMDLQNYAGLLENGCKINGLQCLKIRSATLKDQYLDIFIFSVEFNNPDGTLFTRGPCCGADATQQPPESQFGVRVQKTLDGKYLVLDLPVYLP